MVSMSLYGFFSLERPWISIKIEAVSLLAVKVVFNTILTSLQWESPHGLAEYLLHFLLSIFSFFTFVGLATTHIFLCHIIWKVLKKELSHLYLLFDLEIWAPLMWVIFFGNFIITWLYKIPHLKSFFCRSFFFLWYFVGFTNGRHHSTYYCITYCASDRPFCCIKRFSLYGHDI